MGALALNSLEILCCHPTGPVLSLFRTHLPGDPPTLRLNMQVRLRLLPCGLSTLTAGMALDANRNPCPRPISSLALEFGNMPVLSVIILGEGIPKFYLQAVPTQGLIPSRPSLRSFQCVPSPLAHVWR